MELNYVVKDEDNGMMVKDIVKKKLKVSSRLYKKITKDILLNNGFCYMSNRVNTNDIVTVKLNSDYSVNDVYSKFSPWEHEIDVIYEDEYLIIINKEKGIVCHPSSINLNQTLYNAILNYYIKQGKKTPIHFVNRLDKDTTGAVIVAKHKYIQELLSLQMKDNKFTKEYIAIVYGKMENDSGVIEKRIKRKENSIILRKTADDIDAEYAKTSYQVIDYNKEENYSGLLVKLYTGRTHQIRVHLSSIGHPILGDELYSKEVNINVDNVHKYIKRQALHAYKVSFYDVDNNKKEIYAKIPEDMDKIIKS